MLGPAENYASSLKQDAAHAPPRCADGPPSHRISGLGLVVALGAIFALSSGDRVILPVLKTTLSTELKLKNAGYSVVFTLFMASYTFAYLWVGRILAQHGVRNVLLCAVVLMSASMVVCGAAHAPAQLGAGLLVLGVAQACVMPSVTVAIFQTVECSRHAVAYAVINAIQSLATILVPSLVATVTLAIGWRWSFFIPAATGALVALIWWKVTSNRGSDLAYTAFPVYGWGSTGRELLARKPVVILILARAISDPFWFFFQFWHVAFLREHLGLSLAAIGQLAWIPPLASLLAVLTFGEFSDQLVRRGWRTTEARLFPMFCATSASLLLAWLPLTHSVSIAVFLCTIASMMCAVWLSLSNLLMGALVPPQLLAPALGWMSAIGSGSALVLVALSGPAIDLLGYGPPLWTGAALYPIAATLLARNLRRGSGA